MALTNCKFTQIREPGEIFEISVAMEKHQRRGFWELDEVHPLVATQVRETEAQTLVDEAEEVLGSRTKGKKLSNEKVEKPTTYNRNRGLLENVQPQVFRDLVHNIGAVVFPPLLGLFCYNEEIVVVKL